MSNGGPFEANARDLPLSLFSEKKVMHARLYDEAWFGSVGLLAQFEVDLLIGVGRERERGDKTAESSLIAPRPPYDIRIMAIKPAACRGRAAA